ncbi:hypothetical protein V8G56_06365 [Gaetbulibacter aquiaggeris]|uniref:Uncharacterized protein n=1 Tax=Gaetbulibacter aquiaggeris TaxID=1735373 RepID=A0ABW7MNF6_9FLAO
MKNKCINFYSLLFGFILILGITSCETESLDQNTASETLSLDAKNALSKTSSAVSFDLSQNCDFTITDLFAGQNILVGNVSVSENGDNYEITYNITDSGYCLSSTHLSVVTSPELFPINNGGNPVNGAFEFSMTHDCISSYTYTVPKSKGQYIAAHAVVNCKTTEASNEIFLANIPSTAYGCVTAKGVDAIDSYFNINISSAGILNGDYDAWCVDYDADLGDGHCFDADVYTTLDDLTSGPFEYPETFGSVNWILNQDFISQGYTFAEIQYAIWRLIEGEALASNFYGPIDYAKARYLHQLSLNYSDYKPVCGEQLGIILVPRDGSQSIIIGKTIECNEVGECEETAWGAGCDFPGNNWATYFHYSNGAQ